MDSLCEHVHAFDGCLWRNTMAQVSNVPVLSEFAHHHFSEFLELLLVM